MNGQQGSDQSGQGGPESHLSYLLNSAGGQNALMGYHGALGGLQRHGYGVGDPSLEEQIIQRASALRAEVLMQQQQQQQQHQAHQRQHQHHLGAAIAALQQQQHLSSLAGLNPAHFAALNAQEQEALLGRAAALRELGISGGPGGGLSGVGMERLQQMELGRLEELERRRQQLAALAGFSGAAAAPPRPNEIASAEKLGQENGKNDTARTLVDKPPTAVSAEKSKEELRKTPGTVIVPCRARGMPMDHNFKTAYFVISEDAKHGEDLVCSYFACRNGGVKFRYCAHCMAPVAKRNFCRRHDHGMSDKLPPREDDDEESMDESDSNHGKNTKPPTVIKKPEKATPPPTSSLDVLSKAASSTMPSKIKMNEPEPEPKPEPKRKIVEESVEENHDDDELAQISSKRRKMWSALLLKRPRTKDPRHLSFWLNEVLTVSDFDTPFEDGEILEAKAPTATNGNSPKKPKVDKAADAGSSKKEKKNNGEKKKRKSEKMTGNEKAENSKPKKEKPEKPPKEKKSLSPTKEKAEFKEAMMKMKLPSPVKVEPKIENQAELPKMQQPPAEKVDEVKKIVDESSKDKLEKHEAKEKPLNPPLNIDWASSSKPPDAKSSESSSGSESPTNKSEGAKDSADDGFAGSFADWRDRKKEKMKKGPSLLKK